MAGFKKLKSLLYGECKRSLRTQNPNLSISMQSPDLSLPTKSPNDHYQRKAQTITTNEKPKRSLPTQSPNDHCQRRIQIYYYQRTRGVGVGGSPSLRRGVWGWGWSERSEEWSLVVYNIKLIWNHSHSFTICMNSCFDVEYRSQVTNISNSALEKGQPWKSFTFC
jgi:hypothetical protein